VKRGSCDFNDIVFFYEKQIITVIFGIYFPLNSWFVFIKEVLLLATANLISLLKKLNSPQRVAWIEIVLDKKISIFNL